MAGTTGAFTMSIAASWKRAVGMWAQALTSAHRKTKGADGLAWLVECDILVVV
jgi:hypothetical protein